MTMLHLDHTSSIETVENYISSLTSAIQTTITQKVKTIQVKPHTIGWVRGGCVRACVCIFWIGGKIICLSFLLWDIRVSSAFLKFYSAAKSDFEICWRYFESPFLIRSFSGQLKIYRCLFYFRYLCGLLFWDLENSLHERKVRYLIIKYSNCALLLLGNNLFVRRRTYTIGITQMAH